VSSSGAPAQKRHGPVGEGPEEIHKNDQSDGTPLLGGKAERSGAVQRAEEKAPRRPYGSLPVSEGAYKTAGEGLFTGPVVIGHWVVALT